MIFGKRLSRNELGELQDLCKVIRVEEYKLALVKKNTLLVVDGKKWAKTHEGIIQLLKNERENFIAKCAHRLGFTGPISLDLATGKVWTRK